MKYHTFKTQKRIIKMMDEVSAVNVIEPDWFATYESYRHVIWTQLVQLNCNIFIIEKIEAFPFELFLPLPDEQIFWRLTKSALIEKCILTIARLTIQNSSGKAGKSALTIRQLKRGVEQHISDAAIKAQVYAKLKNIDFDRRLKNVGDKVEEARNNFLAHLDHELATNPDPEKIAKISLSLNELKHGLKILEELFDALCFDHKHILWYWGYGAAKDRNETDIDNLLDLVAKHSLILNMPEQQPEYWESQRPKFSFEELETINAFRRKFNMAEA